VHNFYYNSQNFYDQIMHKQGSLRWNLPLYNPFHALTLICFCAGFIVVPAGYAGIYSFRRKQDINVKGVSNFVRNKRKNRNLVTMKFNMFNWMLETVSTFMMFIFINRFSTLLYVLVNSCGTPLVYVMGIEENRNMAKEYFKYRMRIFSRKSEIRRNGASSEN